jgi:hypothetical protein
LEGEAAAVPHSLHNKLFDVLAAAVIARTLFIHEV